MTREEEIYKGTQQFVGEYLDGLYDAETFARKCARWADEHPKNTWMDVKKELPRNGEKIIFMCSRRSPIRIYYGQYRKWVNGCHLFITIDPNGTTWNIAGVTHWMPRPETPKGGKK